MSLSFQGFDEGPGWDTPIEPSSGDIIKDAMRKEQVIKELVSTQEDLRALYTRVKTAREDVKKLSSGNETLQMYIDNLTMQMAKRR